MDLLGPLSFEHGRELRSLAGELGCDRVVANEAPLDEGGDGVTSLQECKLIGPAMAQRFQHQDVIPIELHDRMVVTVRQRHSCALWS